MIALAAASTSVLVRMRTASCPGMADSSEAAVCGRHVGEGRPGGSGAGAASAGSWPRCPARLRRWPCSSSPRAVWAPSRPGSSRWCAHQASGASRPLCPVRRAGIPSRIYFSACPKFDGQLSSFLGGRLACSGFGRRGGSLERRLWGGVGGLGGATGCLAGYRSGCRRLPRRAHPRKAVRARRTSAAAARSPGSLASIRSVMSAAGRAWRLGVSRMIAVMIRLARARLPPKWRVALERLE